MTAVSGRPKPEGRNPKEARRPKSEAESSGRSGMSIAKRRRGRQAPLGAACLLTAARGPAMPLLTELGNDLSRPGDSENIQHPTSNIQRPMVPTRVNAGGWVLDVGCWMFPLL